MVGKLPPGALSIRCTQHRVVAGNAAPQWECQTKLELHLVLAGVIGPVIGLDGFFIDIAGIGIQHIVGFIRIQRKWVVVILQHVGNNAAAYRRFIMNLLLFGFFRLYQQRRGQRGQNDP
ncbi:hypothetical protein D3C72_1054170 [compost metagenome]